MSADQPESQTRFIEKYGLTYPMLPDTGKQIIGAYGARAVLGLVAKRSTFLIDPEGRVARVWPAVKIGKHAEDVVNTIRELSAR